ncbi:ethanolamine utilization protein EutJ [Levilactobacillus brevis]|uniref:Chaperone protein DnaK n=1 Tax=Levilactobacillus brevis ATCC 14869 = DSM 20054 TaxID=649758 RepID=U2PQL0_LEVBR|nr:ethanolamine utilization protein EutJ [Levilactobacillus brevis]ERK46054.1 putative ethanolamine utilization protein EutJ [Levilactobacillus brevis ATCC 14869 = DSM 20054]KIO99203.1 Ethanolamine utilization protein EutJ [Levilactobacillus brevis]KRK21272.1 ethanolamine utilization protein EutJ [Levilactobacillus brevis ATCC 14869 = DSM 20054]MCT3571781.1 ethanolamine utilization protein EutJ [Levilactobacillus brevis]SQG81802.1 ethanolamine utilization protein EutJ family protein [Levilacto
METRQVNLEDANQQLRQFATVVNTDHAVRQIDSREHLRVGIDLGTSSIVLTVLDTENRPLYGAFEYDHAVRDGIVVNFMESVEILKRLKTKAEKVLGTVLKTACGAIPPGTGDGATKIVGNVIEAAGFDCRQIVDEPTAAATFLQIESGTVIDIGGGTTGVSIFSQGKLMEVLDEATGGFHMTLVLAGYFHISSEEAEALKRDSKRETEVFSIVRPVVEKMAMIVLNATKIPTNEPVIVVGGAINFTDFVTTFSKTLKMLAQKPEFPQFVTPLGIAMYDHD